MNGHALSVFLGRAYGLCAREGAVTRGEYEQDAAHGESLCLDADVGSVSVCVGERMFGTPSDKAVLFMQAWRGVALSDGRSRSSIGSLCQTGARSARKARNRRQTCENVVPCAIADNIATPGVTPVEPPSTLDGEHSVSSRWSSRNR